MTTKVALWEAQGLLQGGSTCLNFDYMHRPLLLLLAVATLAVSSVQLSAQVRPNLRWQTYTTEHFRIHFTDEVAPLARLTAVNAERAWTLLAAELVAPTGMIDIVVADNTDLPNGYANPFPTNRIVIYARPPVEEMSLRNHADWNATLVTHELTHIFHLDRARGWWGFARQIFGRAAPFMPGTYAPAWVAEGIAIHYESKLTEGGRLRGTEYPSIALAAVSDGTLPSLDALSQATPSYPGASAAYVYGSFLFAGHNPDQMGRFVELSSGRLIPWMHNTNARDAFGESFSAIWGRWRDSVERTVNVGRETGTSLTDHGWTARFPRFISDNELIYAGNDQRRSTGLYRVNLSGQSTRLARRNAVDMNSPGRSGAVVFGELDYTNPYSTHSDLYRGTGKSRTRLTRDERLAQPDVNSQTQEIVAVKTVPGGTSIVFMSNQDAIIREIARGSIRQTWSEPRWSRGGRLIAASRWEYGGRTSIVVMDNQGSQVVSFAPSTSKLSITASPVWLPGDTTLLFVSDHEGSAAIYLGHIKTGEYGKVWESPTGLRSPDVSPSGGHIAAVAMTGRGEQIVVRSMPDLAQIALTPSAAAASEVVAVPDDTSLRATPYRGSTVMTPSWWLPTIEESDAGSVMIGGYTHMRDVLGRHSYSLDYAYDLDWREHTGEAAYALGVFGNPIITLRGSQNWLHGPIFSGDDRVGVLAQRSRNLGLSAHYSRPRVRMSTFAMAGLEADWVGYRSYPSDSLRFMLGVDAYTTTTSFPTATIALGASTMQRPGLSVSVEDGAAVNVTMRMRYNNGVQNEDVQEVITTAQIAKSIPFPGFARHVIAVRGAFGRSLHETTTAFSAGGMSGSSIELMPGVTFGDSPRTFFVRGFEGSAQLGVRAASGSAEYRMPISLVDRGVGLFPVFFRSVSAVGFADAGAAWCDRFVEASWICSDSIPVRRFMVSVGGEIAMDVALQYDTRYRFRVGVARPVRGVEYASRATTFYVSLGTAF